MNPYLKLSEAESYVFYKVPKALFTEEKYKPVSTDAKMLYGLLLDRMHLSAKNGWTDKRGRVYQFFTVKEAQDKLRFGHEKICRLFSELEQADLILRKRQGQGKPSIIYLKKF
ncbi:replication initiator protein A [Phocea massiliensis]|uniref:Replication initiator protein A n=1 Tax=Merdimmobilis hominis TaxID=2897707 RepID=A0A938X5A6_9FIRM|nr:replication initiator protein A [Merdimmobilis hominis]MBM6920491.1 replication initiator protein A [Merdimmobilis hominis]